MVLITTSEFLRNVATIRRVQEETGLVSVNLDAVKGKLFSRFERGMAWGSGQGLGLLYRPDTRRALRRQGPGR